jgi:hypothetical protein
MNKTRHSECILYNRGFGNHSPNNKQIRENGCEGCENVNTGEIDSTCIKICKHYKPKKVDEYASDKAMWRR